MMRLLFRHCALTASVLLLFTNTAGAQPGAGTNESILNLMEEIFNQIPDDLAEINPAIQRVAVYGINMKNASIPMPLKDHFESRLIEIFQAIDPPKMVALPELSTLRISSNDSSFSISNSVPAPDELWRVGKRLRVDAFLEGNLTYVWRKALFLDLRLNRTGTNEVLWAKSYKAYEDMPEPQINPVKQSLSAGFEVFQIHSKSAPDSLFNANFNNRLVQYTFYLGLYQYMTPSSRLRYEIRGGVSFLGEGIKFAQPELYSSTFYGLKDGTASAATPVSFNFRLMLHSALVQNHGNPAGDWLSAYFAITRYFARKMPDPTGIGVGLRSDLSPNFSASVGFSMILGSDFDSEPLRSTGETIRLKVDGIHFELLLLQYTF